MASTQVPAPTEDLTSVRDAEVAHIRQRRKNSDPPVPLSDDRDADAEKPERTDLCGLAMSGGGIRSACFNMGLLQALHRFGVYRFVDYLSTVSGGGYIGSHLTSWTLREREPVTRRNFPLAETNDGHEQTSWTKRFIYGGYYLMQPVAFFNKYLIGVVMNNIAVFSLMVIGCAMIAFLWRCLDYPWLADRVALVGLGSDLIRPFLPCLVLAAGWFGAWMISYWRSAAEAPGRVGRRLLLLTAASLLVALTTLVGNGDVALPGSDNEVAPNGDVWSIPTAVWTPFVAVIGLLLLPLLRPERLLASATRPQRRPWEKLVFNATSMALLVGIPLIIVGILARENISGYSTSADRGMHRADVKDWPRLCAILLDRRGKKSEREESDNGLVGPEDFGIGLSHHDDANRNVRTDTDRVLNDAADRHSKGHPAVADARSAFGMPHFPEDRPAAVAFEELDGSVRDAPYHYLQWIALHLLAVDRLAEQSYRDLHIDEEDEFKVYEPGLDRWQRHSVDDTVAQLWDVLGFLTLVKTQNDVGQYWDANRARLQLQDEFMTVFNLCVLPSPELTRRLHRQFDTIREDRKDLGDDDSLTAADRGEIRARLDRATAAVTGNKTTGHLATANRQVLEALYPNIFRPVTDYQRRVVIFEDQWYRLEVAFIALLVFLGVGIWVDVNATSLHRFYRTRLASAFLVRRPGQHEDARLSELNTTEYGSPYHLIGGCVSLFRRKLAGDDEAPSVDETPQNGDARWVDTFLMSREYCGSIITGYVPTRDYEQRIVGERARFDLAEAMAISGAAVSPTQNRNWLVAFLMFALNLRLGQWLPNPTQRRPRYRPRFFYLLENLFHDPEDRAYCFVSDGGHAENLGLVELLKRRCRLIIVSDAGQDPEHHFSDLSRAIRTARIHGGIRFVSVFCDPKHDPQHMSMDPLKLHAQSRDEDDTSSKDNTDELEPRHCDQHFVAARILYPERQDEQGNVTEPATEGLLIYVKPSLTGDESADLLHYQFQNGNFPHQPTSDQMFDEAQVESYRQLGWHIGARLCRLMQKVRAADADSDYLWADKECTVGELTQEFERGYRELFPLKDSSGDGGGGDAAEEEQPGNAEAALAEMLLTPVLQSPDSREMALHLSLTRASQGLRPLVGEKHTVAFVEPVDEELDSGRLKYHFSVRANENSRQQTFARSVLRDPGTAKSPATRICTDLSTETDIEDRHTGMIAASACWSDGEPIGVFQVTAPGRDALTADEEAALRQKLLECAQLMAMAVRNVALYQERAAAAESANESTTADT